MSIDADGSGTVDGEELSNAFLSSGVVANGKICSKLFNLMDVDGTGEVGFDNFIRTITSSSMSKFVHFQKLDSMISSQCALSTETLLSQERRKILMKFVVDRDKVHDYELSTLHDDKTAKKKLASLHKPLVNKKTRALTTSEIDDIAESMNHKKEPRQEVMKELPLANMSRRRTMTALHGVPKEGLNPQCSPNPSNDTGGRKKSYWRQNSNFNILDLIKKNRLKAEENIKNSEIHQSLEQAIAVERHSFGGNVTHHNIKRQNSAVLCPLEDVLPNEVLKMMRKNQQEILFSVDSYEENNLLTSTLTEMEDEDMSDCEGNDSECHLTEASLALEHNQSLDGPSKSSATPHLQVKAKIRSPNAVVLRPINNRNSRTSS